MNKTELLAVNQNKQNTLPPRNGDSQPSRWCDLFSWRHSCAYFHDVP